MSKRERFKNNHVLITGGARGIGLTIATQFSREGAQLTIFDNHGKNLKSAVKILSRKGTRVVGEQVDISDRRNVFQAVAKTEEINPIDILINNAGIAYETSFLDIEAAEWMKVLDVNLNGMFHVSQAVCQHMVSRKKGVIVNMASKNGLDGESGYSHYNASKGGIIMLTKTMALELARFNIRVNAVCPGYIQTPLSKEIDSEEFVTNFVKNYIPMDRPGSTNEIAPAFLFLASQDSSFMTGQTVVIDGGQLAGQKPLFNT
jgi:3-oxoacyl-[acyl-carrier protein] reductase